MGVIETNPRVNIDEDYRLMVEQVLPELGFNDPEALGVPPLENIRAAIQPLGRFLLDRAGTADDRLIIAPRVGGRDGIGVRNLIERYDPDAYKDGYVWEQLWGDGTNDKQRLPQAHRDKGAVHDNRLKEQWQVAVLLGDTADTSSGETVYDPGLVYTNRTVNNQIAELNTDQERARKQDVKLLSAPIGHLVVDAAGLRANGQPQRKGVAPV